MSDIFGNSLATEGNRATVSNHRTITYFFIEIIDSNDGAPHADAARRRELLPTRVLL